MIACLPGDRWSRRCVVVESSHLEINVHILYGCLVDVLVGLWGLCHQQVRHVDLARSLIAPTSGMPGGA